ncbi:MULTISPECIES: RagB/SusD family nutrient uptake outer membrane protein [Mediterranea]|uniref:RagB/SusD family nutrient uptake outer membrane protein n=1 Tax=Mediterranea TaxID=1926659 RepID=UPI002011A30F|nr:MULTISPECIES: RagB/SusD family nutrient uptake outer membrane protein [Mediterranea]MCL1608148.1 RagB/SusD family nutrient uptake outer membrane protein [Mediterranea sp. ET5]MDM8122027.1 RagB/SusD family nutrient uptake outer membrane protein [Mediterranea massiliensis]MDM8198275.1 RagB/SusD family nutrient uptake outer membrane protein [Mediterranea massiliensis]
MKHLYIFALAASLAFTACSDFLEQDNKSNVPTEEFYNTANGFASLTNSAYSSLRTIYSAQPQLFVAGTDLYADGKSQGVVMGQYTFTTDEGIIKDFYDRCYKGIQLANSVIAYGETTEDNAQRLQYIDEARYLRAWWYFQLVQQFGPVALNTEMFESAVMSHERTDLATVYQFIIDEFTYLASADSHLLERASSGVGRANKRAAAFYAAKAYLTRGWLDGTDYEAQEASIAQASDFDNAVTYARQAINGELPALSIEEAFDVNNEENDELFWSVQYSSSAVENPVDDGSYQQSQFGAYQGGSEKPRNKAIDGNFAPSLRLQQMYTRGDGRLEQTFMLEFHEAYFDWYTNPTSKILYYYAPAWATDEDIAAWRADDPNGIKTETIVSKTVAEGGIAPSNGQPASYKDRRTQDFGNAAIKKFDDYTETSIANRSTTCSMHDVVLARLGEAYLIAAEAYYKKGDMRQAAEMINNLRQRPGTIKSGYETAMHVDAADITIDFILDERARELAGEYVRWTDLKRTHKLIEYVTEYNEDGVELSALTGPDGKYKILRPIPQAAIDLNQAHVEQNPGY